MKRSKNQHNVIAVDWSGGGKTINYQRAKANTRIVGATIGLLISKLKKLYPNANLTSFHLIGHSLGAHVMGFAGRNVTQLTGEKIGWITGLDPAGPCFKKKGQECETVKVDTQDILSHHSAIFVEAFHTNGQSE